MSLLVRSAAAALRQTRRLPQRRPYSGSSSRQPLDGDELKRSSILERLEELDAKVKWEIVKDVEKLRRMQIEDRNSLGRLLTWCGVPKGEIRDKLVLGCNLSGVNMYVLNQKINDVAKRVLVKETIECYIDDFLFNKNYKWTAWLTAGSCVVGFLIGRSVGIIYDKNEMKREGISFEGIKQERIK